MVFIGAVDCEVHRLFRAPKLANLARIIKNCLRLACFLLKCVKYLHFNGVKFGTLNNTL